MTGAAGASRAGGHDESLTGLVVSLQVGRADAIRWRGSTVTTAIVKRPVTGPLWLGEHGFAGDEQADLSVHGGPDKAACLYPVEHMPGWEQWLGVELPHGAFGENLTVAGMPEEAVHVGDVLALGSARVQVSQPRGPCFKLAVRWDRKELPARMARAAISGYYVRVLDPGMVGSGDELRLLERMSRVSIADVLRVTYGDQRDAGSLAAVLAVPELADQWRAPLVRLAQRRALPIDEFGVES